MSDIYQKQTGIVICVKMLFCSLKWKYNLWLMIYGFALLQCDHYFCKINNLLVTGQVFYTFHCKFTALIKQFDTFNSIKRYIFSFISSHNLYIHLNFILQFFHLDIVSDYIRFKSYSHKTGICNFICWEKQLKKKKWKCWFVIRYND